MIEQHRPANTLKTHIKRMVKSVAAQAGRFLPASEEVTRILTYHSVGARAHDMNVRPADFRAQMAWLAAHAKIISLEAAAGLEPGVAVTFDDGYQDNLMNAAPVLTEFGIPATIFVVAGRVGGVLDGDPEPQTGALLTWDEIRELEALGITIGAHALTHRRLSDLSASEQRHEIETCVRLFREELGHLPKGFAYPFGSALDYSAVTQEYVRAAGFAFAVSNRYGRNTPSTADRWALRRIWIDATDTLAMFQAKVTGRLDLLSALDSDLGIRARRALNHMLGVK